MGGRDEQIAWLARAGLELVGDWGDWRAEGVPPSVVAWRYVVAGAAEPVVRVPLGRADLGAELNARWHRLASEVGMLAGDGVFLVDSVGGPTTDWARVRLTGAWDLAGVVGAGFVTMSVDGDVLVGVVAGERDVRVVAVEGFRALREAAARAIGEESDQERADAWARLFRGTEPGEKVLDAWARGLSLNPATPNDLRSRLVERSHYGVYSPLPTEVVDALLAHPDRNLRLRTAECQPNITPEQWSRTIRAAQGERERWILTLLAAERRAELPADLLRPLAADPSARVRSEAARCAGLPADLAVELARDPDGGVRKVACAVAWPYLEVSARQALLGDPEGRVRIEALLLHHRDEPMSRAVYEAQDAAERVLETCRLERDLAEQLARHGEPDERRDLARNPRLDADLVALLAEDPDADVRYQVSVRSDLTEDQRARISVEFESGGRYRTLDWVVDLHHDEEAMRRLAASSHFLVRRSVARARHLPPDVVARLARDEDRVVQLFLAESCDDAPADMLMRVWQWWDGSLTVPDRPRGHPNFPREGLLAYADDLNPRMRRLVLDDPESTPEDVERLSRDRSDEVRHRAATDPRLSPAAAARLLEDPYDHIRSAAARHPRLPATILTRRLRGEGDAETAARNPAVPVEVMYRMADRISASAEATE
ncbi:PE-PGRS family protein [Streptomyces sp. NPDC001002]